MASDDTAHQPAVGEVIEPAIAAVALSGAIVEGQVLRLTLLEEAPFERGGEQLRMTRPDKSADRDGGSARDRGDGFIGGGELGFGAHETDGPLIDADFR